jgi:poly-gamma-glutamate system protein
MKMKKVYWRPKAVSRTALWLICAVSLVGLLMVQKFRVVTEQPYQEEKLAAAKLAKEAFEVIYFEREDTGVEIEQKVDPTRSGLVGVPNSSVTSLSGVLESKQLTINPNFAAVAVQLLKDAGVEKGDVVAVGVSGSFPALNVAVYAAIEVLELEPIVISSAASSTWGANIPELLWIDMERALERDEVFSTRSVACSIGGTADQGLDFPAEGKEAILDAIERNNLKLIENRKFEQNIKVRMGLYDQLADDKPIKAYVNVGGGMVSVGRTVGKRILLSGVNRKRPTKAEARGLDGVMFRFIDRGVPAIHLVKVSELIEKYGLPETLTSEPRVGDAGVFERLDYNRWLAAAVLALELGLLFLFIRSDVGFRLFRRSDNRKSDAPPEPMV